MGGSTGNDIVQYVNGRNNAIATPAIAFRIVNHPYDHILGRFLEPETTDVITSGRSRNEYRADALPVLWFRLGVDAGQGEVQLIRAQEPNYNPQDLGRVSNTDRARRRRRRVIATHPTAGLGKHPKEHGPKVFRPDHQKGLVRLDDDAIRASQFDIAELLVGQYLSESVACCLTVDKNSAAPALAGELRC